MEKRTVLRLLGDTARAHPNDPWMKERHPEGWVEATFQEIAEQARGVAGFLLSRGFRKGERVTLLSEGRNSWVSAEMGILAAGGICVPISVKIREKSEILFRVSHSQSRFAIASARHAGKIFAIMDELPDLEGILLLDAVPEEREALRCWLREEKT